MRHIGISGSDNRMDWQGFLEPLNELPPKCKKCNFPDLDHVPQPYFLIKSRTMSPNEIELAANGNFLVRQRVQRILELLAPDQCSFFPTSYKGTNQRTPWMLAVPALQIVTAKVKDKIRRCEKCGEPRSAHPGSQYAEWFPFSTTDPQSEVMKSKTWASSESGWDKWIDRYLYMSLRLFRLLKQLKVKGINEETCGKATLPNKEEAAWIKQKLQVLEKHSVSLHAPGTISEQDEKWFSQYLNTHSRKIKLALDIKAIEKRFKFKLPKSYVEFITKIGPASFHNIDEEEGFSAHILSPEDFDTQEYRAGALDAADEESNAINGVMFAKTDHGDCFCFDVQKSKPEYPVFLFQHEYNDFEPYAENFAACIKRFVSRDDALTPQS